MAYISNNSNFVKALNKEYLAARNALASVNAELNCIANAKNGDKTCRDMLFYKHINMLLKMATGNDIQYGNHFANYDGPADDLIAAAMAEIDHTIEDFDLSTGGRFATLYKPRAFNAMNKVMYNNTQIHIPENIIKGHAKKVKQNIDTDEIPVMISTETCCGGDHDDTCTIGDTLAGSDDVWENAQVTEREMLVKKILGALNEDDRKLIINIFVEGKSLRDMAKEIGVSHELIRKRKDAILIMLKDKFSDFAAIIA